MIIKAAALSIDKSVNNDLTLGWRLQKDKKGDELKTCLTKILEAISGKKEITIQVGNESFKINPEKYYFSQQRLETREYTTVRKSYGSEATEAKCESC